MSTEYSTAAMESWDIERAERAVVSLARSRSAGEIFAMLWRYGARDYRNIGHKAIFVANTFRTLQIIGWQHAEPVLRSLILGLLDFNKEQQMNGYALGDQCYPANLERVKDSFPRLGRQIAKRLGPGQILYKFVGEWLLRWVELLRKLAFRDDLRWSEP